MNHDPELQKAIERSQRLSRQRREILARPPHEALKAILEAQQPAALVHSFPEEDLFFLVQEIGPEDALPLLSLAANKQWEYFLDIDSWQRDRIDLHALVRWLDRLLKADPARFVKWFLDRKNEFFDFLLYHTIEVKIREHDQDPADLGDDFFTLDDLFYIRLVDQPAAAGAEPQEDQAPTQVSLLAHEQRKQFLSTLLERLAAFDHEIYQQVLLEKMAGILPAENEEEAFRLRNVRLAEKGFLPFDEAVGVYQSLKPEDLARRRAKPAPRRPGWESLAPVPHYPLNELRRDDLFSRSLASIADGDVLQELQREFAALNNRIIAADQKTIRSRNELAIVVRKACGYLSIGLKRLSGEPLPSTRRRAATLIRQYSLADIFRVGYGAALELKWEAEKFARTAWFSRVGLPLSFWGETWMGVLGGLLVKKPLYFDNYQNGVLYREFRSLADIETTSAILKQIGDFDNLLAAIAVAPPVQADIFLTYKSMLLTLWARHQLNLEAVVTWIPLEVFRRFFETLWEDTSAPHRIRTSVKEAFLHWAAAKAGRNLRDLSQEMGPALEELFGEIETEYGRTRVAHLDPRYLSLFLVAREKPFSTH